MAEEEKQRPIPGEDDDEEGESDTETDANGDGDGDGFEGDESEPDNSAGPSKMAAKSEAGPKAKGEASDRKDGDGNGDGNEAVEAGSSAGASLGERRGEESRRLFQRLWTDEEEIRILRGFLEFTSRRGTTFASHQYDTGPFYEEIRRQLHLDFSKNQLIEKLRRLKKKYRNCAGRMRSKGPGFSFRSPHEQAIFDIARHIWRPANKRDRPSPSPSDDDLAFPFSSPPPATAPASPSPSAKPPSRSARRARRRLHPEAPPPQPQPLTATAAIPVSVSPAVPQEAALPAPQPLPLISSPSCGGALAMEDAVRSSLSPLFKELIGSAIGPGSLGLFGLGPMPVCPPGKSGDDKWRKQQILELEVYLHRIDLVKEQVMQALQELKGSTT